jgi:RNA polymerase sigma factor (sigma-70 family)
MFSTSGASAGLASVTGGEPVTESYGRIEKGAVGGLADLHDRYDRWLTRNVRRRFGAQDADDLVQETWLRIASLGVVDAIRHPKAFLLRTAMNLALDGHRHRAVVEKSAGELRSPDQTQADQLEAVLLEEIVLSLPTGLRDVFVLSRFAGLSHTQIGEQLGISTKTVEWRMTKATALCTARLSL